MARTRLAAAATFALLAAALAMLVLATPAAAHAEAESSDPPQGARLATAPRQVMVHLSEPVEPSATSLIVVDTAGQRVDNDDLAISGTEAKPMLTVTLREDLGPGAYAIVWKTLSRTDGHPSGDRIGFAVGDFEPPTGSSGTAWPSGTVVAGRALAYLGLALALGAAAWLWYVRADLAGARIHAIRALVAGTALHTLGVLLLIKATADSTGLVPSALAASQLGRLLAVRLIASLGALVLSGLALLPRNPARLGAPLSVVLMGIAAIAAAAIGHAGGEGLPGLLVDALHLAASATWAGGLILLFVALGTAARAGLPAEAVRRIGLRFGTLALICVIVLFLAGSAASLIILGLDAVRDPLGLADGLYGRFLLAKVALALLMVALAAANRYVFLEPPAASRGVQAGLAALGPDGTPAGLRRTVAVEAVLGVVVLVLAAFLTAVSPAVADDSGGRTDVFADGSLFHYHLAFEPSPTLGGQSDAVLAIVDLSTGEALVENTCGRDSCVQMTLAAASDPDQGALYVLVPDETGHWTVPDLLWTFQGAAVATIQVQTAVAEDTGTLAFAVAA
ncbi:MAG: copper resistance protein CopC [Candidatus Thermoplasmatota archaeon]|jgi:copper transport protein